MIDQTLIDQANNTDPLTLAMRYTTLKRVAASAGGEYGGPCPVCGGRDRFHVQPLAHRWLCRHCTGGKWRDVIALYRGITGAPFAEAVTALTGGHLPVAPTRRVEPASEPKRSGLPGPLWQAKAQAFIAEAEGTLWNDTGAKARAWLNARGLANGTLRRWHVGYIPQERERWEPAQAWGVTDRKAIKIERGVLLPCIVNGAIWYLKVRRSTGDPKYTQIAGGSPALFMADTLPSAQEACITEGEFDSMLLWQCLQHATSPRWQNLGVTTLGSKSNRLDLDLWACYLYHLRHIVIMYDQDGESEDGKAYWQEIAGRAFVQRWQNIRKGDKDLTDFHLSGGRLLDLASWGVMQAEYESPTMPGADTVTGGFIAETGLTVINCEANGNGSLLTLSRDAETVQNAG